MKENGTATRQRRVYTVSRLNQDIQQLIEQNFGTLWLQGELSNLARPASGHWYFSLKDSRSQIRCAMFRARARLIDPPPTNGDAVLVRGRPGIYSVRGDLQFIVEHMEPAGAGALQAAFERTRRELEAKGWFDPAGRRALPAIPERIALVTSPTGAAVRDVLNVLERRYPRAEIIIYPTAVQGAAAVPSIVNALERAARRAETDVLLLVRGGGSLEDLWAFNDVSVAGAIRRCPVPVVSGVGHEVDVTIADLVADLRAPTPSAAAELATPDVAELRARLAADRAALRRALSNRIGRGREVLAAFEARLAARHPSRLLAERIQRIDELEGRLRRALLLSMQTRQWRVKQLFTRLMARSPVRELEQGRMRLNTFEQRLGTAMRTRLNERRTNLASLSRTLHGVSPLATLERGYAVATLKKRVVHSSAILAVGDILHTRFAEGSAESKIVRIDPNHTE